MTTQPVPNVTPFTYEGASIRVLTINEAPWWVAADVAGPLALANIRSSLALLDDDEKGVHTMDTLKGSQSMAIISEAGLYSLILRSRKPEAKQFKRWVTHEVLPAIRRTGTYATTPPVPQPDLSELSPRNLAYLSELAKGLEAAVKHAEKNQRKADGYDQFLNGSGCYLVDTAANLLGVKHRRLWEWLYTSKLLIPHGPRKRQPYANPKTASWFAVKTYNTDRTNGKARATTYITPVGLEAIRLRLIREGVIQSTLFALPAPAQEVLA